MAAYVRSFVCLVSREQTSCLTRSSGVVVECKRYVRGLRRKPVKVLFPDSDEAPRPKTRPQSGHEDQHVRTVMKKDVEGKVKTSAAKHYVEASGSARNMTTEQLAFTHPHVSVRKDEVDGLRFERAAAGDKRLARLVSVARSRTFREHQGKILLEGRRLICDALDAGANPQMIFFSTVDRLRELPLDKLRRATLVKVKFEDIKIWSDVVAPQGVIGIFSRPDPTRLKFENTGHSVPLSLICDNVRDPGNLGTMLRCAVAAGCHNVLLSKGCVDAWEPKVLRAGMGAHFRLPIYPSLSWEEIENLLPKTVTVQAADSRCGRASAEEEDLEVNASRKPAKAGEYGWVSTRRNHRGVGYEDYDSDSDSDSSEDEESLLPRVDTKLYHENWAQNPSALVIGGETTGLSLEAVQLAEKSGGHRLSIPVVPGVDSLNSAMAASILLFEGRKQLLNLIHTSAGKWKSKAEAGGSL